MHPIYEKCTKAVEFIKTKINGFEPEIGLILGSGLGDYASKMEVEYEVPYSSIEGFPVSTVQGHDGKFLFGKVNNKSVVCMKGRVHYYEGYSMYDVVMPIRIMALLGIKNVILTNACGGINLSFKPGDLMMIKDHISFFIPSPLIGRNVDEFGLRFPDMSSVYKKDLCEIIKASASSLDIDIKEGVYCQFSGPQFETPTEIKMLRTLGADAVGMSTVCEAIAATHMGVKVCGISCITNMAAGILAQPITHEEVQETANMVKHKFEALISEIISRM